MHSPLLHPFFRLHHLRVVRTPSEPSSSERSRVEDETVLVDELVGIELVGENELLSPQTSLSVIAKEGKSSTMTRAYCSGHGIQSKSMVIVPQHWTNCQRQRREVCLIENGLYELGEQRIYHQLLDQCCPRLERQLTAFLKSDPSFPSPNLTAFLIILPIKSSLHTTIS